MIKVYDLNWNEIDLLSYGLHCLSFIPESLEPEFFDESSEYIDGSIIVGTKINRRILNTRFLMKAVDHLDYQLLRDITYKIFDPRKELYIVDTRQKGKRWKARSSSSFRPEYINAKVGRFELQFIASQPYAESIGTTLDPLTFDSELWQIGQGLVADDVKYIHNTNTFQIYNAGTEIVDPRKFPLIIKYKGASTNLQIKNNTTLETFSFTGSTLPSANLELNRLRVLKNGSSVFSDTNRRSITLAQGYNEIELIGTSGSFEISFDFRFYYV